MTRVFCDACKIQMEPDKMLINIAPEIPILLVKTPYGTPSYDVCNICIVKAIINKYKLPFEFKGR